MMRRRGVRFTVKGAGHERSDTYGYLYVWDTTKGVSNGLWAVLATAYDTDGNNVASVPVTVTVH
ncbi:MAG TPA: hypothetical protein VEZ15_12170, partial [Acidimicrobiia bacterium]|nr:hypothetical protein [Acidimicrobiia bacterium]